MEIAGSMFVSIGVLILAIAFMIKIAARKESNLNPVRASLKDDKNDNIISFTLKIQNKKTKIGQFTLNIPGATKNWTISKCKYEFLRHIGDDNKAQLYAAHANANWVSPSNDNGIQLKQPSQWGKNLSDNVTLGSIGIVNGIHLPLVTSFRITAFGEVRASLKDDKNDMILEFTLKIQGKKTYNIPGANKNWTISKCKYEFLRYIGSDSKAELYAAHANAKWVSPSNRDGIQLKKGGKDLSDNVTLDSIGIYNGIHLPLVTSFRVTGGGPLEVNYSDWTPLYHKCMVCSAKRVNNLSKGYWYHPGGNKAYFTSSKPNKGCIVEMKGDKIRCDGCKTEFNFNDWEYKCDNHDYQKIQ